jgi:hypothetical protein
MEDRAILDHKIHPASVWTFRELLRLFTAFIRVGTTVHAVRPHASGHSDEQIVAAIRRARDLASNVLGPGRHTNLWRVHTSVLMVDWLDLCLAWHCVPMQPIPFQLRANVAKDFRRCIDEMERQGFPVPSHSYANNTLARVEDACIAHLRADAVPARPPPTLLSAQDFIEGMMDMPRAEREAFAARLLARP